MKSERKRVSFIGRTNVGKSSLINTLLGQKLSIVSPIAGTTTDPTEKAIEILPAGPLLFTDTAGIDDKTELGEERLKKVKDVLRKTDMLAIVCDVNHMENLTYEKEYIDWARKRHVPYVFVVNKIDIVDKKERIKNIDNVPVFYVSAKTGEGIEDLKKYIGSVFKEEIKKGILDGMVKEGQHVLCVTPVHHAYPKGRLKPLQVQVIREILDKGAYVTILKPEHVESFFIKNDETPHLVIVDAQSLNITLEKIPSHVPVTSFSMLFANYKGFLKEFVDSLNGINNLNEGDLIAVIEACTHHRLEGDMGKEVLPCLIEKITGKKFNFKYISGTHPHLESLKDVKLGLHCGGCMLSEKDMKSRQTFFSTLNIPLINYGVFLAHYNGCLKRLLAPLLRETA